MLGTFTRHGEPHFAYRIEEREDGPWVHFFALSRPDVLLRIPASWQFPSVDELARMNGVSPSVGA